jgi:GxxExxY protein
MKPIEVCNVWDDITMAAEEVFSVLGGGYSEQVYESALEYELNLLGYFCRRQVTSPISYKEAVVGFGIIDIVVSGIIVEVKAIAKLSDKDEIQLRNYLLPAGFKKGLLINFGPRGVEAREIERETINT